MINEEKDRKRNPYCGYFGYEYEIHEDDYSEDSFPGHSEWEEVLEKELKKNY